LAKRKPEADPVTAFARATVRKKGAARLVKLACERHLRDLKRKDVHFDAAKAQWVVEFFSHLRHSKGVKAGEPFILEPWQAFILGSLFGWRVSKGGPRRFRTAYVEVPRKNGKSTLSAGLALLLAFFDEEAGAEVYCAATKRDQARIVFEEAQRMVKASPSLRKRITSFVGNLHIAATAQKLQPLGADADSMDGLNIHAAIVDELHAHKTRAMVDVLETATGARAQPLVFYITTAGYDRHSVCWERHAYTERLLDGTLEDDASFGFISAADDSDDWRKPATWAKANPNLGVSVSLDDLERKVRRALEIPAEQNAFRRLHLNQWTEQEVRWLDVAAWDECGGTLGWLELREAMRGEVCYLGMDLASSLDVSHGSRRSTWCSLGSGFLRSG
jgi:phage terminase large subunit-like protein